MKERQDEAGEEARAERRGAGMKRVRFRVPVTGCGRAQPRRTRGEE